METMTTPIELLLNDVFQVKETGKVFHIIFKNNDKVQFINVDDYENNAGEKSKIITVTNKAFQKAYDGGQFNIITTSLRKVK